MSLLRGIATGFFRANNERAERMEQRMQALADQNAMIQRERAKSRFDMDLKNAEAEEAQFSALRATGAIDDDGNYDEKHLMQQAMAVYNNKQSRLADGVDFQTFYKNYRPTMETKFNRVYKSSREIRDNFNNVEQAINAQQMAAGSNRQFTGFDSLFATPQRTEVPEVPEVSNMAPAGEAPTEPREVPDVNFGVQPEPKKELDASYIRYDADGTEYAVKLFKDGTMGVQATGLRKESKAGQVEMKLSDMLSAVPELTTERIREGQRSIRMIDNIISDISVETTATLPKLVNGIILGIQEELTGTFGSEAEKQAATNRALNASFKEELDAFGRDLEEGDPLHKATERNELAATIAGLDQNKRSLAYALVRLNRAGGRFNGQELQEQLNLFTNGTLTSQISAVRMAYNQVQDNLKRDLSDAASSIITTTIASDPNEPNLTKQQVQGWISGDPIYSEKRNGYFIEYRDGPYKYVFMDSMGGITLRQRGE